MPFLQFLVPQIPLNILLQPLAYFRLCKAIMKQRGNNEKASLTKRDVKKERLLHGRFELSTFRLHKLIAYETDALPTELVKHLSGHSFFGNGYMCLMFQDRIH